MITWLPVYPSTLYWPPSVHFQNLGHTLTWIFHIHIWIFTKWYILILFLLIHYMRPPTCTELWFETVVVNETCNFLNIIQLHDHINITIGIHRHKWHSIIHLKLTLDYACFLLRCFSFSLHLAGSCYLLEDKEKF